MMYTAYDYGLIAPKETEESVKAPSFFSTSPADYLPLVFVALDTSLPSLNKGRRGQMRGSFGATGADVGVTPSY